MLVMAVLLLAGTTFMTISSTESQIALNEKALARAFHEAESVLEQTIGRLTLNPAYSGVTGVLSGGGGTFTVGVTTPAGQPCPTGNARTIASRASVNVRGGLATVDLVATVDRVTYPFRFAAFSTIPNTIVTDGRVEQELRFDQDAWTDSYDSSLGAYNAPLGNLSSLPNSSTDRQSLFGSVGANGDIFFEFRNLVAGNVRAGDNITDMSKVTIRDVWVKSLGSAATSPGEPFQAVASPGTPTASLTVAADTTHTLASGTGPYYYTNLTMNNKSTLTSEGPVTVYVTGSVTHNGNDATWGSAANPTWLKVILKSTGSNTDFISFDSRDRFKLYGGLYGRNVNIDLGKDSQIFGSVVGRLVRLDDRTVIHYNQALAQEPVCHTGPYQVRRGTWREVLPTW